MTQLVETVRKNILELLDADKLTLPTPPELAMKIRDVAENAESSAPELTRLIARDPAMSARVLQVANSPLFRVNSPIQSLNMAISRLGMNYTANLTIGLAMKQMFQATDEAVASRMERNWDISCKIAAYAAVLAPRGNIPPDEAMLAGLLHRIGALPVLTYAEEHSQQNLNGMMLDKLTGHLHTHLGAVILKKWDFPASLVEVPLSYRKLDKKVDSPKHVDIVSAANLLLWADSENYFGRVDWSQNSIIDKLNLPSDRQHDVIQEIHQKVKEAGNLF